MQLTAIEREKALRLLEKTGMRTKILEGAKKRLRGRVLVKYAVDAQKKFTVVQVGREYGVSKRSTYEVNGDKYDKARGFTLAFLRAIGASK